MDWSFELCSSEEQTLWARMSVFEAGADLDAVEAVCDETGIHVFDAVAGLVDKSVLVPHEVGGRVRYRMLETIREYGAEKLAERGETELIRDRHLDHFLALAEQSRAAWFGPDQLQLLARTTTDLGNLRSAFDHALTESGEATVALELCSALVWYWKPSGALDEGGRWFDRALRDHDSASPTLLRVLGDALFACSERLDVDGALRFARQAVSLPVSEPTPAHRAARYVAHAHLAFLTDDHEAALVAFQRALSEFQAAVTCSCSTTCFSTPQSPPRSRATRRGRHHRGAGTAALRSPR